MTKGGTPGPAWIYTSGEFSYPLSLTTVTYFWPRYDSAFGAPLARVQGIGYVQELVARLTHTPIEKHNSSTNSTLDDSPITFPLNHSLYVDATHEVVVLNSKFDMSLDNVVSPSSFLVITALNLSNFAANGPLPSDHIPKHRSFRVSELAPFSTNVQFQRKFDRYSITLRIAEGIPQCFPVPRERANSSVS
jgi:hypothetical protein